MRQLYEELQKINDKIESIEKFFDAIAHPMQTMTTWAEHILIYIPIIGVIIFMFWMVTQSKKVLNALYVTFLIYSLVKIAIILEMAWIIICIVAALIIIRIVGSVS